MIDRVFALYLHYIFKTRNMKTQTDKENRGVLKLMIVELYDSKLITNKEIPILLSLVSTNAESLSLKALTKRSGVSYNTVVKIVKELLRLEVLYVKVVDPLAKHKVRQFSLMFFHSVRHKNISNFTFEVDKEFKRISKEIMGKRKPKTVFLSGKMDAREFLGAFKAEINKKFEGLDFYYLDFHGFGFKYGLTREGRALDVAKYKELISEVLTHFGEESIELFKEKYTEFMDDYIIDKKNEIKDKLSIGRHKMKYDLVTSRKKKAIDHVAEKEFLDFEGYLDDSLWKYGVKIIPFVDNVYMGAFNSEGKLAQPMDKEIRDEVIMNLGRENPTNIEAMVVSMMYQGKFDEADNEQTSVKEYREEDAVVGFMFNSLKELTKARKNFKEVSDDIIEEYCGVIAHWMISTRCDTKEEYYDMLLTHLEIGLEKKLSPTKLGLDFNIENGITD